MDVNAGFIDVSSSSMQKDHSVNQVTYQWIIDKSQSPSNGGQVNHLKKSQVEKLVKEANKILKPEVTELKYVYFDKLQTYYVQVQDVNTHRVIREIPPKKFMEMYAAIAEKLGLIVNDHA
ncbi:flagellar biosynthesis protein FlaG [Sporolactobacillus sp. THM7-7]|nr:flagellar biosynthesis protein FlaG [Sporolactobacillus sp. THM7-7]